MPELAANQSFVRGRAKGSTDHDQLWNGLQRLPTELTHRQSLEPSEEQSRQSLFVSPQRPSALPPAARANAANSFQPSIANLTSGVRQAALEHSAQSKRDSLARVRTEHLAAMKNDLRRIPELLQQLNTAGVFSE
jgi:hypothetical protein